jgi:hypothetical protein
MSAYYYKGGKNSNVFSDLTWWEIFIAGIATLAIYSFLYRENPFYRIFEHLFIGIATAITIMKAFRDSLWPVYFKPLFGYNRLILPDGTFSDPYDYRLLLYLIPIVFGLLYYFILSKRHAWVAQLPIGFMLGVAAGLAFKGFFNEVMPQLYDSFRSIYVLNEFDGSLDYYASISNIIFIVTLLSAMIYFFFTFRRKDGGVVSQSAMLGRYMMMGCFGAFFGSTIMARMALLVERLQFLIHDWIPILSG